MRSRNNNNSSDGGSDNSDDNKPNSEEKEGELGEEKPKGDKISVVNDTGNTTNQTTVGSLLLATKDDNVYFISTKCLR